MVLDYRAGFDLHPPGVRLPPPPPHPVPRARLAHPRVGRVRSDPGLGAPPTTTTHRGARDDAWRLRLRRHKETEERAQRWREVLQQQQARQTRVVVVVVVGWGWWGGEERERTLPGQKAFLSFSCEHHVGNDIVISVIFFWRCCMGSGSDM